jgi:citrate synthase
VPWHGIRFFNSVNLKRNMKTNIFIIGLSVGLLGQALAQTNQPGTPPEVTNEIPSDALVTKLGTVYHEFRVERVEPAGITISYVLDDGGLEMEKITFDLLPDDWQQRYGYDPEKAAAFELEQKRAMAQMRDQMIADEQAYREKRAQEEAAEEAAKKAAETAATQATNAPAITDTNLPAPPLPSRGY